MKLFDLDRDDISDQAAIRIQKIVRGGVVRQWNDRGIEFLAFHLCLQLTHQLQTIDFLNSKKEKSPKTNQSLKQTQQQAELFRNRTLGFLVNTIVAKRKSERLNGKVVCGNEMGSILHYGVLCYHPRVLELLIKFGFEVKSINSTNRQPLHCVLGKVDNAAVLLAAGADVNKTISYRVDGHSVDQITPLHLAVIHRNGPLMRLLLQYGANINAKDSNGNRPGDYLGGCPMELETYNNIVASEVQCCRS